MGAPGCWGVCGAKSAAGLFGLWLSGSRNQCIDTHASRLNVLFGNHLVDAVKHQHNADQFPGITVHG